MRDTPTPDTPGDRRLMLGLPEVAQQLGVSQRTVTRLVEKGKLAGSAKIGRRSLWPRTVIEDFVTQLGPFDTLNQEMN